MTSRTGVHRCFTAVSPAAAGVTTYGGVQARPDGPSPDRNSWQVHG